MNSGKRSIGIMIELREHIGQSRLLLEHTRWMRLMLVSLTRILMQEVLMEWSQSMIEIDSLGIIWNSVSHSAKVFIILDTTSISLSGEESITIRLRKTILDGGETNNLT